MSTQTEIPDDEDLHETAIRHANEAWTAETDNFDQGRDDQRFAAGEQWLPETKAEREAANRPIITINRIMSFVRQVTGDVRRDTPAIKIAPAKGPASEEMADVFNGAIRNIEVQSNAKAAYVQGTENACITGMGNIKVITQYSTDDRSEQDLRIKRITDPFAVVWDPMAKEPDKSDARYLHEYFDMAKEEFRRQFPDSAMNNVPTGPNGSQGMSWWTNDTIRMAYYWYRTPVKKTILQLADGRSISAEQALKETKEGDDSSTIDVISKRKVDTFEVKMALISGTEILSPKGKPEDWAGQYIPYAPVIGEEIWIDGRCIRKGMVRDLKDAQRIYNYMRTAAAEAAALQPKAPFIVTVNQVKGLEDKWAALGRTNVPYITYNPDGAAPGAPQRSPPAMAQDGLDQQAMLAGDEMKAISGIYDASLGNRSNETSGRAILARQKEGDTGTYHYIDNLGTAIRRIGIILVDIIPKIYDTPRVVRVLREDGSQEMVGVNTPHHDPLNDVVKRMNDLAAGEYDVTVTTGPSFATRRMEAMEGMQELIKAAPQLLQVAGDILIKNMDFPQAEEVAKRLEPKNGPPPIDPKTQVEMMATAAKANLAIEQAKKTEMEAETLLAQLMQMGANIQQLTATVNAIAAASQGGGGMPGQPPPGGPPPGMPPQGPPPVDASGLVHGQGPPQPMIQQPPNPGEVPQ